ncbi:MAG: helicase-related protein [Chloroflexota bacterium]
MSDIIDNRNKKLVDEINSHLNQSGAAHFAVGYFFLSGFEAIAAQLNDLGELRLLIGNTTNQQTIEQLAEGYRRLELVNTVIEGQVYRKRTEAKQWATQTAENIRAGIEVMDQTDEAEQLVATLARMIEDKRLKVRIYTKGRLHAKAYIFDHKSLYDKRGHEVKPSTPGVAIVGSSNLTLSGVNQNTELNIVVHGADNHTQLKQWFDKLWNESEDFDAALMDEMRQSWALMPARPYDLYMKTLYTLVKDRLEGEEQPDILWADEITRKLADFQKVAVRQAIQMIRDNDGAFVADVVGLGKSFIGAAIVKHFERAEHARPLIICPAPLTEMWERYNEVYQLNARVVSMGMLTEQNGNPLLNDVKYRDRDFVLIDESHNLRHRDTQRYRIMESFLATGRRCCLLTATPRNKSAWDVYYQIKLFHQDDRTDLPIAPPNLREYFNLIENGERNLPDLLANILVRRTRTHVLRWYGFDSETHEPVDPARFSEYQDGNRRAYVMVNGRHQFFPRRELMTIEYSIEDTYQGLYQSIRKTLGKPLKERLTKPGPDELSFARYGLWRYVIKSRQKQEPYVSLQRAGANLRGLIRILLFKRFESSVFAFCETVRRLLHVHEMFLEAMNRGFVPAGEKAQSILYESDNWDENDLMDTLEAISGQYSIEDFDAERLAEDIQHDIDVLRRILEIVEPITPEQDAKLRMLKRHLAQVPFIEGKCLIFTQYADTAAYLYRELNPDSNRDDIEVIYSGNKSKARIVGRFSPKSNPEYHSAPSESEIKMLIATDVLAEGLNLQDCNIIINYDLHWNPVRLIQRFGRIDRIGSEHDVVYGFNFLPETGLEKNLGLREKLHNRIQEIHDTIGEDAFILDGSEQLNPDAFYAIYEKTGGKSGAGALDAEDEYLDLSEAEEIMRQLRKEDPTEYERIAKLRDGIRAAMHSDQQGTFVFCQSGRYQQLFLIDANGAITSRDLPRILGTVKCNREQEGEQLPRLHNRVVMQLKHQFAEEVKHREAQREYSLSLTQGQRYILKELRILFGTVDDEDIKGQINLLEKAFRGPITRAVVRELNVLRRNGVKGEDLFKTLAGLYYQHNMRDWLDRQQSQEENDMIVRIVCSEALL